MALITDSVTQGQHWFFISTIKHNCCLKKWENKLRWEMVQSDSLLAFHTSYILLYFHSIHIHVQNNAMLMSAKVSTVLYKLLQIHYHYIWNRNELGAILLSVCWISNLWKMFTIINVHVDKSVLYKENGNEMHMFRQL